MCGINGFLDFKRKYARDARHDIVHRMNDRIIYRGPDSEGIYDGDWFTMGMRRLAIVDINSGNQPIFNENNTISIVFNGEIYNHRKLREQLRANGHIFKTDSDTEVVVHLYEEKGTDAFAELDGMYAFSIFDYNKNIMIVVRDRMGEKPLYYSYSNEYFYYASELRSIIDLGVVSKEIDSYALQLYLKYTYIPAPYSIYRNVRKLRAGHYLTINSVGEVKDDQYWNLTRKSEYENISYSDAKERLRELLDDSVRLRMDCDVPYGAFLSGGIDSGVISALMVKNSKIPIDTFTIGYEDKSYDESENARWMANHLGTRHHEHILTYKDTIDAMNVVSNHFDEPFADSSAIPVFLVSKYASQYVKVVLTGDAGDEMFLGYDKYAIDYYLNMYRRMPAIGKKSLDVLLKIIPDKSVLSRKIKKVIAGSNQDSFSKRNNLMKLGFKDSEVDRLLLIDAVSADDIDLAKEFFETSPLADELARTQYTDIKMVLEGDMFAKVDRMTMLNSLESRTPLISNEIVEFAYNIPLDYKLDGKNKKKILKETFVDLLPEGYDKLPKKGFGVPLDHWFRNEMKEELTDLLSAERIKKQGIFDAKYVENIVAEHMSGKMNRKGELWSLYVFEKWMDNVGGNI